MPLAKEVSAELRRIADALDKEPETVIHKPWVTFYCDSKQEIVDLARLLPRPLTKSIRDEGKSYAKYTLQNNTDACWLEANVDQTLTCRIVEPPKPAVYECEPLFSAEEEEALL